MTRPPTATGGVLIGLSAAIPAAEAFFLVTARYNHTDQGILLLACMGFLGLLGVVAAVHGSARSGGGVYAGLLAPLGHAAFALANFTYAASFSAPVDIWIFGLAGLGAGAAALVLGLVVLTSIGGAMRWIREMRADLDDGI